MKAEHVGQHQTRELLWALLMQFKANKTPVVINKRYLERALTLGKDSCPFALFNQSDTVKLVGIDPDEVSEICGL